MKVHVSANNFTGGEMSPRMLGRADLDRYNQSAEELSNVVVLKQGGATIRPPLAFVGDVSSQGSVRIVPFIFSRTDSYVLVFRESWMQVIKNGQFVFETPGIRYEMAHSYTASQLAEIDFTQGLETMIITHGSVPPKRLRRLADAHWVIDDVPFKPAPMAETGERPSVSLSISSGSPGSGRTLTAGSSFFLAADVGREVVWNGGAATITAVASGTSATATVTSVFPTTSVASGAWLLTGSPRAQIDPDDDAPIGKTITLTMAAAGWRSSYVGMHVEINGGLVRITSVASSTSASGIIVRELLSTVGAPADAWALLGPIFNAGDGYPETCTFFEQRLWFANTKAFPQSKWASRSGLYFDFTPGTEDDSAVYKTVFSDQQNPIQYLVSGTSLVTLGYGGEFEARGGVERPITQQNMQIKLQSEWGSERVRPETAGKEIVFVERGGKAIRTMFPLQVDGFDSTDISVFSEHLMSAGIKCMTFERRPEAVMWIAMRDGTLRMLTFSSEQSVIAWSRGATQGSVEWLCSVPESGRDVTYAVVSRTIGGVEKRFIERFDWTVTNGFHDCRTVVNAGSSTITGLSRLNGASVRVHGDGVYLGQFTVTDGTITLPRSVIQAVVGLGYDAKLRIQAPEVQTQAGTAQGQAMSINHVKVRLLNSIGLWVQGTEVPFRKFGPSVLDSEVEPFTGIKDVSNMGWANGEAPITIEQRQGYPFTILAVLRSFTVNPS